MKNINFLLIFLCIAFAVLVSFGIHGYSFPVWHNIIDGSAPTEILFGEPQMIRSDDWVLDLPIALSQGVHDPKFPLINKNIALGGNVLFPIKALTSTGLAFFRPSLWGFLLGPNQGLAWMWWFLVFGLFYSFFEVFKIVSRGEIKIAFFGALALVFSSYFQAWSFHKGEIVIGAALLFVVFTKMILSHDRRKKAVFGVLLGWCFVFMLVNILYPPIWVAFFLLFLVLVAGTFLEGEFKLAAQFSNGHRGSLVRENFVPIILALIIISVGLYFSLKDGLDSILSICNTTYPGRRISQGGGIPFWSNFSDHFLLQKAANKGAGWGPLGNPCEVSTFLLFFPIIIPFYIYWFFKLKKITDWFVAFLTFYICLLVTYQSVGLPAWLCQITFLSVATPNRVVGGIGVASFILTVRFLSDLKQEKIVLPSWKTVFLILGLIFFVFVGYSMHRVFPDYPIRYWIRGFILQIIFLFLLFSRRQGPRFFFPVLCLFSFFYIMNFNPIVRGGFDFIEKNSLSLKIKEVQAANHSPLSWVVMAPERGDTFRAYVLSNFLRMISVPSLGGYQCPPELRLLNQFFDSPTALKKVNQCAFFTFIASQDNWRVTAPFPGQVMIYGRPNAPAMRKIGIGYYLVVGKSEQIREFFNPKEFSILYSNQDIFIFKVKS